MAALTLAFGLALSGCSSSDNPGSSSSTGSAGAEAGAFPVTISSALGDAVIKSEPQRIVTWGWSAQDAVLALGEVPVAMPKQTYGGNEDGVLPWDAEQIKKLGGKTPALLSGGDTNEVPFEEIAAAKPDVILAPYSGLTQADFDRLSKLAPVVAYPNQPWALPWQDQLSIVGKALGKSKEAQALRTKTDDYIAETTAQNPAIKGKSFFYAAANQPGVLNVYKDTDPRTDLLVQMGMKLSPSIKALDPDPTAETYFYALSYEKLDEITTDVLVMYFGSQKDVDAFTSTPAVAAMPAIKEGRFAPIVGESFVMASSAPTVLSIPWMLDRYAPKLAEAASKVS